jgi:predicted enzyme related to lactoylglutathione lyase
MNISSQITFLYFNDYKAGCTFLEEVLTLETVYDPGWAKVYRSVGDAYIGAVNSKEGSIDGQKKGGVLISLTVDNIDNYYEHFKTLNVTDLSEVKHFDDIGLRSFFFKGPEGYDFEIQEFLNPTLKELF